MAINTLGHKPEHASSSAAKTSQPGFGETRRARRWRWHRGITEPAIPPVAPDAETQTIPRVHAPAGPAASTLPPLHRDPSTNPDKIALHIIELCAQCVRHGWSSTQLNDALLQPLGALHKRAMHEQEGGARIARRAEAAARAPQEVAAAIEAAVLVEHVTGVPVELDPEAMGRGLAALTVNAGDLTQQTLVGLPKITDDMPDPRTAQAAPVEVTAVPAVQRPWDGMVRSDGSTPAAAEVRPAIPDEPVPAQAPLPHRRKITSFPAAMSAEPGVPLDGSKHEGADLLAIPGAWLLFGALWVLVESVSLDATAEHVVAQLAVGDEMSLVPDAPVWLLTPEAAVPLASAYRAQVDELEASR